jgi:hypothetical protein
MDGTAFDRISVLPENAIAARALIAIALTMGASPLDYYPTFSANHILMSD